LLAGAIHDSTQRYGTAFLIVGIVAAAGALLALFLRGLKPRHVFS
jgi:hypothetical protein